jgi:hypothetical protein
LAGEPRRESVRQTLTAILAACDHPLRTAEVGKLVAERLGRDIDRSAISSQLQAAEAEFNPVDGTWTAASEKAVESDLDEEEVAVTETADGGVV